VENFTSEPRGPGGRPSGTPVLAPNAFQSLDFLYLSPYSFEPLPFCTMQQKLKAVFRSASRKKAPGDRVDDQDDARSPRSTRVGRSLDEQRRRQSGDTHGGGVQYNGRSRPLSSVFDPRRSSAQLANGYAQSNSSNFANDAIANDYRAYMSGLSQADKTSRAPSMSLGGDRRLMTGESKGRHEEDVADRNIDRYRSSLDVSKRKPLPATPAPAAMNEQHPRNGSVGTASFSSKPSTHPSDGTAKYSLGGDTMTRGGLQDSIRPHVEDGAHVMNRWKDSQWPSRSPREESRVGWSRRKPRGSESEEDAPGTPPDELRQGGSLALRPKTTINRGSTDIEKEIDQLLDGVVDLRDTVDDDKDVTWAPAVTHEVVKPHEHELVQHKIFREIHNYEHHHYIQPVYDIEVLPPRHWISNPNGDGLIEISADEIPSRTGNNRRWKIVVEEPELPIQPPTPWHSKAKIIEHPTQITKEGFERKETTIIHPPTLADLTEYSGLVQPIHFDHKTGKRWLGPISTMHQLRQELGAVADPNFSSEKLPDDLPKTPGLSEVPPLSQSPELRRKTVRVQDSSEGRAVDKHDGIAVAV